MSKKIIKKDCLLIVRISFFSVYIFIMILNIYKCYMILIYSYSFDLNSVYINTFIMYFLIGN